MPCNQISSGQLYKSTTDTKRQRQNVLLSSLKTENLLKSKLSIIKKKKKLFFCVAESI